MASDNWSETRRSWNSIKAAWKELDDAGKNSFVYWLIGVVLITVAVIAEFRWTGLLLCVGYLFRWTSGYVK